MGEASSVSSGAGAAHVTAAGPGWSSGAVAGGTIHFAGYLNEPPLQGVEAGRHIAALLSSASDADAVSAVLAALDGHFSFVLERPSDVVAAVDRIRSIPLFLSRSNGALRIDNSAHRLRSEMGLGPADIDSDAALSLAMAGYTLGARTLYSALGQLRAGEFALARDGGVEVRSYYRYQPWLAEPAADRVALKRQLTEVTRGIFEKMARSAGGRPILVPLSAGLDSRLVASGLKEVGYRNVHCFSYGLPGNFEAAASRRVAERLGYPWFFLPMSHAGMAADFGSERHARYLDFADTCASVPVEHEFAVAGMLAERGWGADAIIVNGQTGDFLTGGHVPRGLVGEQYRCESPVDRMDAVCAAIIGKHFSLWGALKTPENLARIRAQIAAVLEAADPFSRPPAKDYALCEFLEWESRQSRYVVTNQRVYEFAGFDWRLPMWDKDYLEFWERVPAQHKLGQALFKEMLMDADWGGVWKGFDVPRWVSPNWLRVVRPVLKLAVGAVAGRSGWQKFDKRFLSYWNDVQAKIAIVPYGKVASDCRGWRSAVSWLAEAYLARHHLDYRGQRLP